MADVENTTISTLAKVGTWLKENKAFAIPVAAVVLGYGAATLGRRRDARQSYEDGFESGWDAAQRRRVLPEDTGDNDEEQG